MVLFFGPPGSGKTVQGQKLVERNDWQWISTGDLFRRSEDPEVISCLAAGELIADELTNKVLSTALATTNRSTDIVLDGYPRNVGQAEWLQGHLADYDRTIDCAIIFEVPRDVLIERQMGRGRPEDIMDIISHRLDIYNEKTRPVLDFYRVAGTPVIAIDGTGDIEAIHERVQEAVMTCLKTV